LREAAKAAPIATRATPNATAADESVPVRGSCAAAGAGAAVDGAAVDGAGVDGTDALEGPIVDVVAGGIGATVVVA
jgi:hypothetical protein